MVALLAKRKPAALSPERLALAEAVERQARTRADLQKAEEASVRAFEKYEAARARFYGLEEAPAKATDSRDVVNALMAGRKPMTAGAVATKSAARTEAAGREMATWEEALAACRNVIAETKVEIERAAGQLGEAVSAVLAAEGAAEGLIERLEKLQAETAPIRAALHVLIRSNAMTADLRSRAINAMGRLGNLPVHHLADFAPPGAERDPVALSMAAAIEALKQDPAASVSPLDIVRGAGRG